MRPRTKLPIPEPKGSEFQNFDRLMKILIAKKPKPVVKKEPAKRSRLSLAASLSFRRESLHRQFAPCQLVPSEATTRSAANDDFQISERRSAPVLCGETPARPDSGTDETAPHSRRYR